MSIRVKAIEKGYFGGSIRNEGDVFEIENNDQFSERWMEKQSSAGRPAKAKKSTKADSETDSSDL